MKATLVSIVVLAFAVSFGSKTSLPTPPLSLCETLNKVLKDEANTYRSFKGKAVTKNDDNSVDHLLTIGFAGWDSCHYVQEEKGGYVELYTIHSTRAKAQAHFSSTLKTLETCMAVKGDLLKKEGGETIYTFDKGKTEVMLAFTISHGNMILVMTIQSLE